MRKTQRLPVHNSNCNSELGQYKWIHHEYWIIDWLMSLFVTCQTCVQSDFTMVRLGPCVKQILSGDWTHALPLIRRFCSFLRHHDCSESVFCAVNLRMKESNFKQGSEQNILHGSNAFAIDLHLVLGTGSSWAATISKRALKYHINHTRCPQQTRIGNWADSPKDKNTRKQHAQNIIN